MALRSRACRSLGWGDSMRIAIRVGVVLCAVGAATVACKSHDPDDNGDDAGVTPDPCVGRQCDVAPCRQMNQPDTAVSGRVFAPNGTLPLSGIDVYVPAFDPGPMPDGLQCARCSDDLPGM